jgi:cephalosporin hydroxylase
MKTRKELPFLLNSLGLVGEGAEIGVFRGGFSEHILTHWTGKKLYSIDSWTHQGKRLDKSDATEKEQLENKRICEERLKEFKHRSSIIHDFSVLAATRFESGKQANLDFVYIDAAHDYRSVWADLEAWYPRIKVGGMLAGHDYKNSFVRKNLVEVKRAVDDFFRIYGLMVNSTTDDNLPSWYVIKL